MIDSVGNKYFYLYDGLGSVAALLNVNSAIVERYSYDPFGITTITDSNGSPLAQSAVGNPYMFTGRRYDPETAPSGSTGLYYYRARMYSPTLGRFLQTDPIGYGDGANMYAYCSNNPVNFTDPLGLCKSGMKGKWFLFTDAD